MSNLAKNILIILMIIIMAVTAFLAGYFANDFMRYGTLPGTVSAAPQDFALLSEAWQWVELSYLGEIPPPQRVAYGAIRGALAELGDPYTLFVEPPAREQERENLRGNFGGIGATLSRNEANELILEPIPGNPAEAAGILPGDVLLAVDGVPITAEMPVGDVVELIKGEKGTLVTLTVRHPGQSDEVDIAIERDDILIPSVSYRLLDADPTIGYIQLTRFSGESGQEVHDAILDLQAQGAEKLILDLRHNPGGLLDAAVAVADSFLRDVPVLYQQNKGEEEKVYMAGPEAVAGDMPLVLLVDGGTASSAEIVAGALRDHGRAVLIGSPTYGKGSVQLVYDLTDGSSVHVTSSRWFTPNRHQIDQQGLQPDIVVEVTQEAIDAGRDDVLSRAIDFLQNGNR